MEERTVTETPTAPGETPSISLCTLFLSVVTLTAALGFFFSKLRGTQEEKMLSLRWSLLFLLIVLQTQGKWFSLKKKKTVNVQQSMLLKK